MINLTTEKLEQYEEALNVAIQLIGKDNEVSDTLDELVDDIGNEIQKRNEITEANRVANDDLIESTSEKTLIEKLIDRLKNELKQGNGKRTELFLDMVLSNGDVLVELEEQLENES